MPQLAGVMHLIILRFDQAAQVRAVAAAVPQQLVLQQVAPAAAVDQQVFHFRKAHTVDLQLVVAPLCEVADLPAREAYLAGFAVLRRCQFTDHCLDQQ